MPATYEIEFVCNLGRYGKRQKLGDSLNFFPLLYFGGDYYYNKMENCS